MNENRLQKVLVSAMKQSLKSHLPTLNPAITLKEFFNKEFNQELFIAHCEEDSNKNLLLNSIKPKSSSIILIGPEGDFTKKEIDKAIELKFKPISLGESRFRAETAAIIATHTVSIVNM